MTMVMGIPQQKPGLRTRGSPSVPDISQHADRDTPAGGIPACYTGAERSRSGSRKMYRAVGTAARRAASAESISAAMVAPVSAW